MHERVHTNEKPYKCNDCDKSFKHSADLEALKISHEPDSSFSCSYCRKLFNQKSSLDIHVKIHHTERRNYYCLKCNVSFVLKNDFDNHNKNCKDFQNLHTEIEIKEEDIVTLDIDGNTSEEESD